MANPVNTFAKFMLDTMSKSAQTTYADILNTRAREDAQAHDLERQQKAYENDISKIRENYDLQGAQRKKQQGERAKRVLQMFGVDTLDGLKNALKGNRAQEIAIMEYITENRDIDERLFATVEKPPPEPSYQSVGNGSYGLTYGPNSGSTAHYAVAIHEKYDLSEEQRAAIGEFIKKRKGQATPEMLATELNNNLGFNISPRDIRIDKLDTTSWRTAEKGGQEDAVKELDRDYGYNSVAVPVGNVAEGDDPTTSAANYSAALENNGGPIGRIVKANSGDINTFRSSFSEEIEFNFQGLDEKITDARDAVQGYRDFMAGYNETSDPGGKLKTRAANIAANAILSALTAEQTLLEKMEEVAKSNLKDSQLIALIDDIRQGVIYTGALTKAIKPDAKNWLNFEGYLDAIGHFEEQAYTILGPRE